MMTQEEMDQEVLECARYGEDEDLLALLNAGANVNHLDYAGNTALHKAAANGNVGCLKILVDHKAINQANQEGNFPTHWAAQNGQLEALQFLFSAYPTDVLVKNCQGRSVLTEAFQSGKTEVIELCLSHESATEERLLDGKQQTKTNEDGEMTVSTGEVDDNQSNNASESTNNAVQHQMIFGLDANAQTSPIVKIRELPITRADNPFGSDESPEDDTTGLGIWPASILLSQLVARLGDKHLSNKIIVELGAGCGLPALTSALYCHPKKVYITDIHEPTLRNAAYNVKLNNSETKEQNLPNELTPLLYAQETIDNVEINVSNVNWKDIQTFPQEKADIILGSDLVYDYKILDLLIPAIDNMLTLDGSFLYIAPDTGRDGMAQLIERLAEVNLLCVESYPVPAE